MPIRTGQPQRPAPRPPQRRAPGPPPHITDDVHWTRILHPRERYRIVYVDRDQVRSERTIELLKLGDSQGVPYVGVMHEGRFKTLRLDRIVEVKEQYTTGHPPSIHAAPTYSTVLPIFPVVPGGGPAVYRVATVAKSNRTWTVDLNAYTCTCPEKRIRSARGYKPGQLGSVCPHMARAILAHLPSDAGWSAAMLDFLGRTDPRNVHIDNLPVCLG